MGWHPNTEAAVFAQMIRADEQVLTPDVARYLLATRLPASDEARVNESSEKAQTGALTETDTQEPHSYLHLGFLLGVLQAKARDLLAQDPGLRHHESGSSSSEFASGPQAVVNTASCPSLLCRYRFKSIT